jgi:outer membrane protein OmpA-like peptidoglycan-associated protein
MRRGTRSRFALRLSLPVFWLAGCGAAPEGTTTPPPTVPPEATEVAATPDATPQGSVAPEEESGSALELTAVQMTERFAAEGKVTLREIGFRTGTAELLPAAHPQLAQVVVVLREQPAMRLRIQVHSDAQGSGEFNQRITDQRALAIKDWLAGQGVDVARLEAAGYGEQQPVAPNSSAEGRAANRRVELVVVP